MVLLDDDDWKESLRILDVVSTSISTSLFGALNGPLSSTSLLHLVVETAKQGRFHVATEMVDIEIETRSASRYYSDLAEYRLLAARLALKSGNSATAHEHWREASRLLIAYGVRKDTTVYELLDSLPELINRDPAFGRSAVARLHPLCERIPQHTDGKGTYRVPRDWYRLLAMADPCALARLVGKPLLSGCNRPDHVMYGARTDLWRSWHSRADPVISGALRLTLTEALEHSDSAALARLTTADTEQGH